MRTVIIVGTVVAFLVPVASARAEVIASSTFDTGLDGWTVDSGNVTGNLAWSSTGGNPGGFLLAIDGTNPNGIMRAPGKYLGNWTPLDGTGTLSFDHKVIDLGAGVFEVGPYTVDIAGPTTSATWTSTTAPNGVTPWVNIVVPIEESAWSVTSGTWAALLADVTRLRIHVELIGNNQQPNDLAGLDNVVLSQSTAIPEPASIVLLAVGALGIVLYRRRSGANHPRRETKPVHLPSSLH